MGRNRRSFNTNFLLAVVSALLLSFYVLKASAGPGAVGAGVSSFLYGGSAPSYEDPNGGNELSPPADVETPDNGSDQTDDDDDDGESDEDEPEVEIEDVGMDETMPDVEPPPMEDVDVAGIEDLEDMLDQGGDDDVREQSKRRRDRQMNRLKEEDLYQEFQNGGWTPVETEPPSDFFTTPPSRTFSTRCPPCNCGDRERVVEFPDERTLGQPSFDSSFSVGSYFDGNQQPTMQSIDFTATTTDPASFGPSQNFHESSFQQENNEDDFDFAMMAGGPFGGPSSYPGVPPRGGGGGRRFFGPPMGRRLPGIGRLPPRNRPHRYLQPIPNRESNILLKSLIAKAVTKALPKAIKTAAPSKKQTTAKTTRKRRSAYYEDDNDDDYWFNALAHADPALWNSNLGYRIARLLRERFSYGYRPRVYFNPPRNYGRNYGGWNNGGWGNGGWNNGGWKRGYPKRKMKRGKGYKSKKRHSYYD